MSRDIFDLRAYYRDRVSGERARRTGTFHAARPDGTLPGTKRPTKGGGEL